MESLEVIWLQPWTKGLHIYTKLKRDGEQVSVKTINKKGKKIKHFNKNFHLLLWREQQKNSQKQQPVEIVQEVKTSTQEQAVPILSPRGRLRQTCCLIAEKECKKSIVWEWTLLKKILKCQMIILGFKIVNCLNTNSSDHRQSFTLLHLINIWQEVCLNS